MIKLKNVSVKYVKDYYSLYNVNLEIYSNALLIGDAASGNNFLLRLLAKIDKHYDGEIFIDNINLKQIKDKDLNLAYIQQTPCLFENKSVLENLIYPLKIRKINKIEAILRAKTVIKPYFLKISEIFNKTNTEKIQKEKIKINKNFNIQNNFKSIEYNKSYNDKGKLNFNKEKFESNFESNKTNNVKLTQNGKQTYEDFLDANVSTLQLSNETFENLFEKFLNTKVKNLDLSTKKIITLLRAKIREPKYILIEYFFENLNDNYFASTNQTSLHFASQSGLYLTKQIFLDLANEIILDLQANSTIIATQNDEKIIPAYKDFNQIFFDAGNIIKQKNNY